MADHDDHIHVGFAPQPGEGKGVSRQFDQLLKPEQWERLIDRIGEIDNPTVPTAPSEYALPAGDGDDEKSNKRDKRSRASSAHVGE